jgi:hypothetical protein
MNDVKSLESELFVVSNSVLDEPCARCCARFLLSTLFVLSYDVCALSFTSAF